MGYSRQHAHRRPSFAGRARNRALTILLQLICTFAFLDILPANFEFTGPSAATAQNEDSAFGDAILSSRLVEEDDFKAPSSTDPALAPSPFAFAAVRAPHVLETSRGTPQRFGEFAPAYPARAPPSVLLS